MNEATVTLTTDPASLLQQAADKLEELADAATQGPWIAEYSGETGDCVIPHDAQSTREYVCRTQLYHRTADAKWIATMHPGIARPLAQWLNFEADDPCCIEETALDLARVILGIKGVDG